MEKENEFEMGTPMVRTLDREARTRAIGRELTFLKDKNEEMNKRSSVYIAELGIATKTDLNSTAAEETDAEMLTAEFRHQLGLLPEEDQQLTTLFKARLGLNDVDDNLIEKLTKDRKKVLQQYPFENFMHRHFINDSTDPGKSAARPLLQKEEHSDRQASQYISTVIRKFVYEDYQANKSSKNKLMKPVMLEVYRLLDTRMQEQTQEPHSTPPQKLSKSTNSRTYSLKKLLTTIGKSSSKRLDSVRGRLRSSESGEPATYEDVINKLSSELDYIHFILSHGIIRKQLRDEIFSQLCLEILKTTSVEAKNRVWILHVLTAACFLPSSQMVGYYFGFLHENSSTSEYAVRVIETLGRTNANGPRYHPSNYIEYKAAQLRRQALFDVTLVDGRTISVPVDSAVTSQEICIHLCQALNINDYFGFSLYISNFEKVSSLGCGSDHVMDAVTECEHMSRERGVGESNAPWCLFFRKEIFTPWFDPSEDIVSTRLIYTQAKLSIIKDELSIPQEVLPSMLSQSLFVEFGHLTGDVIKEKLASLMSPSCARSEETVCRLVVEAAERMSLNDTSLTKDDIMQHYVANVAYFCALSFSALFEACPASSTNLAMEETVVAVNSQGLAVLDRSLSRILVNLNYCEIVNICSAPTTDLLTASFTLTLMDGRPFTMYSPNSDVIDRIVSVFLAGLRRRSRWAVAIRTIVLPDPGSSDRLELTVGDTVELLNEAKANLPSDQWLLGRCERTGKVGRCPLESVYVIPTPTRPMQEFINMLRERGELADLDPSCMSLKTLIMEDSNASRLEDSIV